MKYLLICLLLTLCGCRAEVKPVTGGGIESDGKVIGANVNLGLLFELQDGTRVYRFEDCGVIKYLVVSPKNASLSGLATH